MTVKELLSEIEQSRKLKKMYEGLPLGNIGVAMIQRDIDAAEKAIVDNDIDAMTKAYKSQQKHWAMTLKAIPKSQSNFSKQEISHG